MRCGFCRKASLLALGLGGLLSGCQGPTPPAAPAPRAAARPARERRLALAPGTAALATLAGGTTHAYLFALPAGQYADLAVDQRGFDVALTLAGPDGRTLTFVDGPYGDHGPEPVPLVAETAGTYRLEVRASDVRAAPGPYALLVRALRPATEEDRTRVAAERAYARGEALRGRRDRAAVVAAIAEDQRALGLFAGLNDPARRADTLASLGWAHDALGEETAALGLFEQALALFRAQGREREMGEVLNDLGKVRHHRLGEPRRALACYREALALNHRLHEPR
ncbi:MAG: hypothetical protein QOJ16_3432, partial [Acidobacteriota bacterium]|nr:hypothetical protein [Acidobacteriota bacterium]